MDDRELYRQVLGITAPWLVSSVSMELERGEIRIKVECSTEGLVCPHCGEVSSRYDTKTRRWRHLDTCHLRTIIEGKVPRIKCKEHGVQQVSVPWAEEYSRFTALFERLVISWLECASVKAVATQCSLSWDEVDRIQQRAVTRGLLRRKAEGRDAPTDISVDETSYQKHHQYVTVVADRKTGEVVYVADDRTSDSLQEYYSTLTAKDLAAIQTVSMDMSRAYIGATERSVPDASEKICFDRFHVMKILGDAVDKTRRSEHKTLLDDKGKSPLSKTRFLWLAGEESLDTVDRQKMTAIRKAAGKTARAWEVKEYARSIWNYRSKGWATRAWKSLTDWTDRSRLIHVKKAGQTVKNHLYGIINAVLKGVSNATAESLNSKIQEIKRRACGFRSKARFKNAILFHLGGLNMDPVGGNKHWKFCHSDPR